MSRSGSGPDGKHFSLLGTLFLSGLAANPEKVGAMRALGVKLGHHGPDFDAAREWIAGEAARSGARFVGQTEPELIAASAPTRSRSWRTCPTRT